ncbi:hypothetical protein B0H63DRAFT_458232 [Podospora didyma]|uniref:Uncharacterized protein n=1 Tax=Podospora didyma TaxID=330526 RepID=A0AAE0P528_9PEZI|nr:hypothetical protein B0H63DRAFT_458232 [Podospora didyma]
MVTVKVAARPRLRPQNSTNSLPQEGGVEVEVMIALHLRFAEVNVVGDITVARLPVNVICPFHRAGAIPGRCTQRRYNNVFGQSRLYDGLSASSHDGNGWFGMGGSGTLQVGGTACASRCVAIRCAVQLYLPCCSHALFLHQTQIYSFSVPMC